MFNEVMKAKREQGKAEINRMECPKCKNKMVKVGALTINIQDESDLNGQYCAYCYREWVGQNMPKFFDPEKRMEEIILKA